MRSRWLAPHTAAKGRVNVVFIHIEMKIKYKQEFGLAVLHNPESIKPLMEQCPAHLCLKKEKEMSGPQNNSASNRKSFLT